MTTDPPSVSSTPALTDKAILGVALECLNEHDENATLNILKVGLKQYDRADRSSMIGEIEPLFGLALA